MAIDELIIKSKLLTWSIGKLISRLISKKTGLDVNINLKDFKFTTSETGDAYVSCEVGAIISSESMGLISEKLEELI